MASFFIQLKVAQVLLSRLFLSGKSRCPCRFSCIICGCLCVSYISVVRDIWHFQIWLTFLSFCCCLYISLTFNSFTVEERNTAVIARYSFKCCIVRVYCALMDACIEHFIYSTLCLFCLAGPAVTTWISVTLFNLINIPTLLHFFISKQR